METEAFIAEILARPAIWKSSHPQHKFKNIVKKLWEEIKQQFLDSDVNDLKKKWKNLRDTYSKELKRIPKPRSGSSTSNYEPSWKYFTLLGFLKDEYMPLASESNLDENAPTVNENDDIYVDDFSGVSSPATPLSPALTSSPIEPSTSSGQDSTRKRQSVRDIRAEYLDIEKKKLKILEKESAKQHDSERQEEKSEDYHFLMSILPEMEKLPPMQKIRLRNKINQALLDEITVTMYGEPYGRYGYSTQPNQLNNNFNNE